MTTHEQEQRVETLVAAYLQAAENGENPDPDQLIHENPQFSSELTEFFRVCQEVDNLVHPSLVQEANCRLRGEPTMAHPAFKFDYRTSGTQSGGYNFIVLNNTQTVDYRNYDSPAWKSVTTCVAAATRGRAEQVRISRGGGCGAADYIDLRNVRLEDDAVACP